MCVCVYFVLFFASCVSQFPSTLAAENRPGNKSHITSLLQMKGCKQQQQQKVENSRNAEEWVQGQKVYIAQIDGMTHVWGPVSELHSLCREASRIGALQYSCACLFNHIWRRLQAAVRDSQNRWIGLWSSHGIPCFLLRSNTPPFSKYQHKPIPTPARHRSPPPPDPRQLLPRSTSVQNSTPRLLSSLFPTSKVGHCLLCIIQQLEWLCVRALDCDLGDMQPAGGVQSKKKKKKGRGDEPARQQHTPAGRFQILFGAGKQSETSQSVLQSHASAFSLSPLSTTRQILNEQSWGGPWIHSNRNCEEMFFNAEENKTRRLQKHRVMEVLTTGPPNSRQRFDRKIWQEFFGFVCRYIQHICAHLVWNIFSFLCTKKKKKKKSLCWVHRSISSGWDPTWNAELLHNCRTLDDLWLMHFAACCFWSGSIWK